MNFLCSILQVPVVSTATETGPNPSSCAWAPGHPAGSPAPGSHRALLFSPYHDFLTVPCFHLGARIPQEGALSPSASSPAPCEHQGALVSSSWGQHGHAKASQASSKPLPAQLWLFPACLHSSKWRLCSGLKPLLTWAVPCCSFQEAVLWGSRRMRFLPVPPRRYSLVHSLLASKTAAHRGLCQELRVFFHPRKKRTRFL